MDHFPPYRGGWQPIYCFRPYAGPSFQQPSWPEYMVPFGGWPRTAQFRNIRGGSLPGSPWPVPAPFQCRWRPPAWRAGETRFRRTAPQER